MFHEFGDAPESHGEPDQTWLTYSFDEDCLCVLQGVYVGVYDIQYIMVITDYYWLVGSAYFGYEHF